jgi:hypothetical protein
VRFSAHFRENYCNEFAFRLSYMVTEVYMGVTWQWLPVEMEP